ncbi:MAG: ABC transporter substrate-binding protein [Reyranella sp.]|nr:ABC transporter substrate-binding protein [Reyranella sp.]MBL6653847.1 ABC transporter substrate-binding protein [Reyranella sp.]
MIGRRLVFAGAAALASAPATGQTPLKIGWLSIGEHPFIADFRQRMRELGYIESENLLIEVRYANGNATLLPGLVDELANAGVAMLVVSGSAATDAALAGAKGVPIVFVSSDPTISGSVASLARPGGGATGVSTMSEDISPKKVGLLRDAVPNLARLAVLDDGSPGGHPQSENMANAARRVGMEAKTFTLADPAAFGAGFADIASHGWQAAAAVSSPLFTASARQVAELTVKHKLPAIFDTPAFVQAGALMSYGPDLKAVFRRQAEMVARLGRGTKLADMPVEQATKFIFAFNQATARAWGLSLSMPVLAAVDELVE